jgi:hypothetical protein
MTDHSMAPRTALKIKNNKQQAYNSPDQYFFDVVPFFHRNIIQMLQEDKV